MPEIHPITNAAMVATDGHANGSLAQIGQYPGPDLKPNNSVGMLPFVDDKPMEPLAECLHAGAMS